MTTHQQTFEEAVAEFITKSRAQIGTEANEGTPPPPPSPYEQGIPHENPLRFDSTTLSRYAWSIGDDNPLFTDREYAKRTRYGAQLAPGPILALVKYPSAHGAQRSEGYPLANFISGAAWEFYNVVPEGSRYRASKVTKEVFEKKGSQGNLVFIISDNFYWNFHGDLDAKCYGTQIFVPIPEMGASRAMSVDKVGEKMMYTRGSTAYTPEQIQKFLDMVEGTKRRGADTLYWEDVEVGDKLPPQVLPPWTLQDQVAYHYMGRALTGSEGIYDEWSFEPAYYAFKKWGEYRRTNPLTRWPYEPGSEHEDAVLAAYRGQPGPFDFGVQRTQIPQQVVTNWMGDDGFIRRLQIALRRPAYYSDVTIYTAEVVKKFTRVEEGDAKPGGAPGKHEYCGVGLKVEGSNQVGQVHVQGTATVYLPSRKAGSVVLPVPHVAKPPFVPYETFYRDWY